MINPRSIIFRLILLYLLLLCGMGLAYSVYTYIGLKHYLIEALEERLQRRAELIALALSSQPDQAAQEELLQEIDLVLAPEASSRFVRITDATGRILYISGSPEDGSFLPSKIPPAASFPPPHKRIERGAGENRVYVTTIAAKAASGENRFYVEVGGSDSNARAVLRDLLVTLALGFPGVLWLGGIGGYLLIRHSFRPVSSLMKAAESISINNPAERLPIMQTGDDLEQLTHSLNRMIDRLDESVQQAIRFTADASHELRTPLSVMRGEIESTLRDHPLPDDVRESLGNLLEETERLSRITEGLMTIARLDAGEARVEHSRFDLGALLALTTEQMLLLAEEKKITITREPGEKVWVNGDAARMKQVIVNLLDNAIKYTPAGGRIWLNVKALDGHVCLRVTDNGAGIPPEALSHVFKRFYRADKARARGLGGSGLGLSIVRSIVHAHGGTVEVDSTEGKGSAFTVIMPVAEEDETPAKSSPAKSG